MKKSTIETIFQRFSDSNPEPKTELNYTNDFTLLVAIVLSAQSTDAGVNKATARLFEIADTPQKMAELGLDALKSYIKTIGLYNSKAKNIVALSKKLLTEYDGDIPDSREELQKLPGVGRKTANVFLNCAHGHTTIAVDTHVFRVANRIGLVKENNEMKTELALEKIIPEKWKKHAHHWLILHGRYICKARKPECSKCLIKDLCLYYQKSYTSR